MGARRGPRGPRRAPTGNLSRSSRRRRLAPASDGTATILARLDLEDESTRDDIDATRAAVRAVEGRSDALVRLRHRERPAGHGLAERVLRAVAELHNAFGPIGEDLRWISVELEEFATGSGDVGSGLDGVRESVAETRAALSDNGALLDDYRDAADRAGAVASQSRDDLGRSVVWARVSVLMLGLTLASLQFVPWWLAARFRSERDLPDSMPPS